MICDNQALSQTTATVSSVTSVASNVHPFSIQDHLCLEVNIHTLRSTPKSFLSHSERARSTSMRLLLVIGLFAGFFAVTSGK